uniref:Uncharacterized protein n=1 Tax=Opuntia streptacantha TaxID=393608 RepID=A0A7C8YG16_OPUST
MIHLRTTPGYGGSRSSCSGTRGPESGGIVSMRSRRGTHSPPGFTCRKTWLVRPSIRRRQRSGTTTTTTPSKSQVSHAGSLFPPLPRRLLTCPISCPMFMTTT